MLPLRRDLIVFLPFFRIGKNFVRLIDFLELLYGRFVTPG